MQIQTSAILLSYLKYGESSAIVRVFTEKKGFQALMWKGVYSKKNKSKYLLQPLNEVQLCYRYKENDRLALLQKIEAPLGTTQTLPIEKSTLLLFLSEVLSSLLQNEPESPELFQFVQKEMADFRKRSSTQLWIQRFLLELTRFLGAKPYNNYQAQWVFNLASGSFNTQGEIHALGQYKSGLWAQFLSHPHGTYSPKERLEILDILIAYFEVQFSHFHTPKSLDILKEIFTN